MTRLSSSLPAVLLSALALAGCGLTGESAPPPPCPRIVALDGADSLTRFAGAGRDLTDIAFEAEIAQLTGSCSYDDEGIDVTFQLRIIAARGPADTDRRAAFGYLVAVADLDQQVLSREGFDTAIEFPGTATRASIIEEVERRVPLAEGRTGADYVIYVGFEVSREELEYNRRQGS
ncbi:hypothetical protein [Rhodospirillaceae bacterium SYSU D60014]|uniref:hypothetical protein n=1 Tax=Virgifigura deserti TaxID=2268457 RepID=UPI000E6733D7